MKTTPLKDMTKKELINLIRKMQMQQNKLSMELIQNGYWEME